MALRYNLIRLIAGVLLAGGSPMTKKQELAVQVTMAAHGGWKKGSRLGRG